MMKFTSLSLLAASLASIVSAVPMQPQGLVSRAGAPGDRSCEVQRQAEGQYNGGFRQACVVLINDCMNILNQTQSGAIWSQQSCVAAATCDGSPNLYDLAAKCSNVTNFSSPPSTVDHLDYNIYATIVGDCAWKSGGCPITQQNFIDFVYGSLSAIGSTVWPTDANEVVNDWWNPIVSWAATGETVPYTNFDDWLHYSTLR